MSEEGILYYHEVFTSIQGESTDMGKICTFVRLYGCNVKCSYCDQPQSRSDRHKISISNMVSKVLSLHVKNVCITGGEPLLQWNSVYQLALELVYYGCNVSIETNGCVKIPNLYYPRGLKFVMDVKCPSSGVSHKNIYENLMSLRLNDEVKFVISNREDYDFMKRVLKDYPTPATKLVSPVMSRSPQYDLNRAYCLIGKELVDWLIEDKLFNVRVQIQMHKCLGVL